jgi:hypothetical protein
MVREFEIRYWKSLIRMRQLDKLSNLLLFQKE